MAFASRQLRSDWCDHHASWTGPAGFCAALGVERRAIRFSVHRAVFRQFPRRRADQRGHPPLWLFQGMRGGFRRLHNWVCISWSGAVDFGSDLGWCQWLRLWFHESGDQHSGHATPLQKHRCGRDLSQLFLEHRRRLLPVPDRVPIADNRNTRLLHCPGGSVFGGCSPPCVAPVFSGGFRASARNPFLVRVAGVPPPAAASDSPAFYSDVVLPHLHFGAPPQR